MKRFDPWLIAGVLLLLAIGLLSLYSVDAVNPGGGYFKKQLIHIVIGIVPFSAFFLLDPRIWQRYANVLYGINIALLLLVLFKGHSGGGAQRWLQIGHTEFQPSELAKLLVVLTLAAFLMGRHDRIRSFSTFALSFLYVLPPLVLVFLQPHLGATLVILVAWLSVCIAAGVRLRFLFGALLFAVAGLYLAVRFHVLKPYQEERVLAILHPNSKGNAYQAARAEIAFGVGSIVGTGPLKGQQKANHYIPEQQNDFIFTVIGEEEGLIGCTLVLLLYGLFYYRIWVNMVNAEDAYYKMLFAGIFGMLAFHTIANLGMNLQLLPVVGLWLPFMSYGGTAMWLCMACVALLLNMRSRQRPVLY